MATSGTMYTSYYNASGGYGRYKLYWWVSATSGLVETISYQVSVDYTHYRLRPYSCYLELSSYNDGTVSTSSITILPAGSYSSGSYPDSGTIVGSGTFKVTHSSSTAKGGFTAYLHGGMYDWSSTAVTGTTSFALDTLYTSCSAPISVTASGIVAPSGSFTVSWSGASGGTNNSISSYQVYYQVTSNGSAPTTSTYTGTKNVTSTSSSGSTTITLSSATRGYTVVCGVVTRGSAGSTYYSSIKTGGSVTVNYLPAAPTVSASTTRVPSTGQSVTFTLTAGSDSNSTQTRTVRYNTTGTTPTTSNTTKITSGTSKTISSGATYYFWTYDGLEFSSSCKTISFTLNIKPSLTVSASPSLFYALNSQGNTGYRNGWCQSIKPSVTCNKSGVTVTVTPQFSASSTTTSTTSYSNGTSFNAKSISSTSATALDTYDMNAAAVSYGYDFSSLTTPVKWRLKFDITDGFEAGDTVYYPSGGYFYAIPNAPSVLYKYNQHYNSDINGTNAGQMWKNVRFQFYNDESVTSPSVTATVNGATVTTSSSTSMSGQICYLDVTCADGITSGATINFTISLTNSSNSITKKFTTTMTETLHPTITTLTHGAQTIKPFTDTGTFECKTGWPFGSYTTVDSALSAYNCGSGAVQYLHATSSAGANAIVPVSPTWSKSSDDMTCTLDRSTIYGWNNQLSMEPYVDTKTYYAAIRITNLFGKTYTTPWLARYFNFNELATSLSISSIQWAESNTSSATWNTFYTGASGNQAQEGIYLRFNLDFSLYTTDDLILNLRLTNDSGTNTVLTQAYAASELSRATSRSAVSNTVQVVYGPVSEIASTNNRTWAFKIQNKAGTTVSSGIVMAVARQTAPTLSLTTCEVDQNYTITYAYTQTDTGGGTITNYLYGEGANLSNALTSTSGSLTSLITGWEVKSICVRSKSEVFKSSSTSSGPVKDSTKYYESNYIIVYQLSPTIAYRKNLVGVNTNAPASTSVVDIHQASGKNLITFQGQDTQGNAMKFEMDIVNGTISLYKNSTLQHTVNLLTGTLT